MMGRKLKEEEVPFALQGFVIKAAHKDLDPNGYPMVELLLMGQGGYQTVRFTADGHSVSDLIVTVE